MVLAGRLKEGISFSTSDEFDLVNGGLCVLEQSYLGYLWRMTEPAVCGLIELPFISNLNSAFSC